MKTTVEIKPEHRTALLELAARRGQKAFDSLLGEAIASYLAGESNREQKREKFFALAGVLNEEQGEELQGELQRIRASWRDAG